MTTSGTETMHEDHETLEVVDGEETAGTSLSLIRDTRGLTTVEYIIILCLIAVVGFGVWKKFGEKVSDKVEDATGTINELDGVGGDEGGEGG